MKLSDDDLARIAEIAALVANENENIAEVSAPIQLQVDDKIKFTFRTFYAVFSAENSVDALKYARELCRNADEYAATHLAVRNKCMLLMNSLYYETDKLISVPHDDLDVFADKVYELLKQYIIPMKEPNAEGADYDERDF